MVRGAFGKCLVLAGLASLLGCGQKEVADGGNLVLVKVGEYAIRASELRNFEAELPDHLKSSNVGMDSHREHLQGLVDRQLVLSEARNRKLDSSPEVRKSLTRAENARLIQAIVTDHIVAPVRIEEKELKEAYERYQLGWEVWPAHIQSATEEEAREVIRALEGGADFHTLARERSQADDANVGGDLRGFFGQGDAVPALREATFHLEVGEFSQPIKTVDGFEVVKILDKRRRSFALERSGILSQLKERKMAERRREFLEGLKEQFQVRYHGERAAVALRNFQVDSKNETELEVSLISFASGAISIADYLAYKGGLGKKNRAPRDSLELFMELEKRVLPDRLMTMLAREEKRDLQPEFVSWKEKQLVEFMIQQFFAEVISSRVEIAEEEARQHYEQYLDTYTSLPGPIELTEVLVETEAEALEILTAARQGAELEDLARSRSVRSGMKPVNGHTFSEDGSVRIETLISSPYREVFGDVNREDIGKVQGPLLVQDKYSVFRLDAPVELVPLPYKQVHRPILRKLRINREAVIFDAYIDSLRSAAADRIEWNEDHLKRFAESR
jgi:peptidyl-prolyl cis-trans isomerase C